MPKAYVSYLPILRKTRLLTQADLAKAAGLNQPLIAHIEAGKKPLAELTFEKLEALASQFHLPVKEFVLLAERLPDAPRPPHTGRQLGQQLRTINARRQRRPGRRTKTAA